MGNARVKAMDARRRRWGAVAVEFGFLLPVFLLIVLGCIDFGRFARAYIVVTNACGEAATFAAEHAPTEFPDGQTGWINAIRQRAVDEGVMLRPPIDAEAVVVDTSVLPQGIVRVEATYEFEVLVPWPGIPEQVTIGRAAVAPQMP